MNAILQTYIDNNSV